MERIESADAVCAARNLYGGVGHKAVVSASELHGVELMFVSAGLGLVKADQKIPSYDLTVTPGGPGPFGVLDIPYHPEQWWGAIHHRSSAKMPLAEMVQEYKGTVVLALPSVYLKMLFDDLDAVDTKHIAKLRIITTANSTLPARLREQSIAYDDRLNGIAGASTGAMTSLVQRAALHFIGSVLTDHRVGAIDAQRKRVGAALSAVKTMDRPTRNKFGDVAIVRMIKKMTHEQRSSVTTALTTLRHTKQVACEQNRFKGLYEKAMNAEK
ncbi:MAG: hypothetical protein Q8R67_08310 [Rhodoferax sp.]|nr:hypothetical protein [Rhodoferax sp.]MDP3651671.1 hypothetical protein [Rhodoferax sp.]